MANLEKDLLNSKLKKKKGVVNPTSTGDLINEVASIFEDEEDQLSNEENIEESDEDDLGQMDQNTEDENSTDNDDDEEENSITDSISF